MPRILSVDDSHADRTIVAGIVRSLGFELDEACDGLEGLDKVCDGKFDLVVLDLEMPDLDGAGMLEAMRVQGDSTPVLVLASEIKKSTIAALMKMGIKDFLLKPFAPEELTAKILAAVGTAAAGEATAAPAEPAGAPGADGAPTRAASPADAKILIVDDMEEVRRKLRELIPRAVAVDACAAENEALLLCRKRQYRLILFDVELPVAGLPALLEQYRALQPQAIFVGIAVPGKDDVDAELREIGFDDLILRPFDPRIIEDMVDQYSADYRSVVVVEENLLRVAAFRGRKSRLDEYLDQVRTRLAASFRELALACWDRAILDAARMPPEHAPRVARLLAEVLQEASGTGLELRLVASGPVAKELGEQPESKAIRCHSSVEEARA